MSGRIRTIKPEVLEDEIAVALSDSAWRLWVSLWVLADDHGNVRLTGRYLAANVWQDTTRDVSEPLGELVRTGFVKPYAVRGQLYGHIKSWDKHQRVDNAGKSRVPRPEEDDGSNPASSPQLAEVRRESPRVSENLGETPKDSEGFGEIPPRARAPSPTTTTTNDPEGEGDARGAAASAAPPPDPHPPPKSEPRPKARPARDTRLPDDWEPTEDLVADIRAKHRVDPLRAVEKFKSHFLAASGRNATKRNWNQAFRLWILNDIERGVAVSWRPPAPPTPPPPPRPPEPELTPEEIVANKRELDELMRNLEQRTTYPDVSEAAWR